MSARLLAAATLVGLAQATAAPAQTVAARVAAAPDGEIRISYSSRPDVMGNGGSVIQWHCGSGDCRQQVQGTYSGVSDLDWRSACDTGPVRLMLHVRGGEVTRLRVAVGGTWVARPGVVDFGRVAAPQAAQFLIDLVRHADGAVGDRAIFAATLADSVSVWPDLLRLARDEDLPRRTRRSAVFWVSQAAEEAATRGLDSLVDESSVDREVREQAVFALSQRPRDEGVPALIRIARTHPDPDIRRKAIFWLGQSDDPRALALFEDLLTKP
jgi:HEAT repeat protein